MTHRGGEPGQSSDTEEESQVNLVTHRGGEPGQSSDTEEESLVNLVTQKRRAWSQTFLNEEH